MPPTSRVSSYKETKLSLPSFDVKHFLTTFKFKISGEVAHVFGKKVLSVRYRAKFIRFHSRRLNLASDDSLFSDYL